MNDHQDQSLTLRQKRLRYQSWHRGTKEADLILGRFIEKNGCNFNAEECEFFERLLQETDQDILNWITKKIEVPKIFQHPLMAELQKLEHLK